jgi:hypothetical protein
MGAWFLLADAAKEGKDVVLSMLLVGCVFLVVIGIGEFIDWRQRARMHRRARLGRR